MVRPLFSCLTINILTRLSHFLSLSEMMLNLLRSLWNLLSPLRYKIYPTSTISSLASGPTVFIVLRICAALPLLDSLPRLRWNTFKSSFITHTLFYTALLERNTLDYCAGWLEALGDLARYRILIAGMVPTAPPSFVFFNYCCCEWVPPGITSWLNCLFWHDEYSFFLFFYFNFKFH
jgi:hypothetical protein